MKRIVFVGIIVVLVVILWLAMTPPGGPRDRPVARCRAEIEHIHNALLDHKIAYGEYPTMSGSDATALASTAVTNWMPKGRDFVDEWGTPYYLEIVSNNTDYVLVSFGPDKKQGTKDDISTRR
jgi:hypothetical protein